MDDHFVNLVVRLAVIVLFVAMTVFTAAPAKPTLGICFTGQASRFNGLDNKIEYFLQTSSELYVIDLYFVLADGEALWVQRPSSSNTAGYSSLTAREIVSAIRSRATGIVRDIFTDFSPQIHANTSLMNRVYMSLLENFDQQPLSYISRRALSHMRQFDAMRRCWNMIQHKRYDLYARLREDIVFFRRWSPPARWMQRPGIHVPGCQSWHGLNDKAAFIVGGNAARVYYKVAWQKFTSNDTTFLQQHNIFNSETFLHAIMDAANIPAYQHCQNDFPLSTAAAISVNDYCFRLRDLGFSWDRNDLACAISRPIGFGYSCFFDAVYRINDTQFPLTCHLPGQIDSFRICQR